MAKIEALSDIGSLANTTSARAAINDNFEKVEDAFQNTLSRDGSQPNQMEADIDLNGHYIVNLADPVNDGDAVNKRSVEALVDEFAAAIIGETVLGTLRVVVEPSATAGQDQIPLPSSPGTLYNVEVFVDGAALVPSTDFTLTGTNADIIQFTVPFVGGEEVMIRYAEALASGLPDDPVLRPDLASTVTGKGGALVGFKQDGTGAIDSTVTRELKRVIHVEQFASLAEGADWKPAIDYALALASSIGGANVRLAAKDYGLSGSIVVPSGCGLIGQGAGQHPRAPSVTSPDYLATPRTRLMALAGFPAGTFMVDVNITRGVSAYANQAVRLEGLVIDGNAIAEKGLRWRAVKNSTIRDVGILRPTVLGALIDTGQAALTGQTAVAGGANTITFGGAAASPRDGWFNGATVTTTGGTGSGQTATVSAYNGTTKVATVTPAWTTPPDATTVFDISGELEIETLPANAATQFNIFDGFWVWLGSTGSAVGIEFDGDGAHDVNQNSYRNLRVHHADGPAIRMYNGDTDWFDGVATYAFGNGYGLEMHGSDTTNFEAYPREQFFDNCLFGGANVGATTGTAAAGAASTITLAGSASATDDYYNRKFISITGGTGVGQRRKISDYNGTTKVATISENWTTNPDATSAYSINGGGGVALFKGTYRTARRHTFDNYEAGTNGAGEIYAEAGGSYVRRSQRDYDLTDEDGFEITLGAGNAYATGTSSRLNFYRKVLGTPVEMASIREVTSGAEATSTGSIRVYTRKAGATPTETIGFGDGVTIGGGTAALKKQLRVSAAFDFPSVPAQGTQALTATVTGAAVGDIVLLGLPSNGYAAGLAFKAYVSAADTVTLVAQNFTAAAIDPGNLNTSIVVHGY